MRSMPGYQMALLSACGVLFGCVVGPAYQQPAPSDQTAYVAVGHISEDESSFEGGAAMQIVGVDGHSTGLAPSVRVTAGTHRFTVRHFNSFGLFDADIKYEDISFLAQAGGDYRIDGSYCCGYILGMFDLYAYDDRSGQQVAAAMANAPK
jgi:hypothetical protein